MAKIFNKAKSILFEVESDQQNLLSRNSFGFLRLALATTVVFQHAFVLSGHSKFVYFGIFNQADLGSTGVGGFFALSGFLLAGSVQRLRSRDFLLHRAFRLLPGLWFALFVIAFLIVPIASATGKQESTFSFFTGSDSSLGYFINNLLLVVRQDGIGTVFGANPYPLAVDGSLWTLAPEFLCYVGLLMVGIATRRNQAAQIVILVLAIAFASGIWMYSNRSDSELMSSIIHPASGLGIAFAAGALLHFITKIAPLRPKVWLAATLMVGWIVLGLSGPFAIILLSLAVVLLGLALTSPQLAKIGRTTDVSYGIYLFHFPIIQTIISSSNISWTPILTITFLPMLALLVALPISYLSWKFVEKPSIDFARARTKR